VSDALISELVYRSELSQAAAADLVARIGGTVVTATADYSANYGETVLASKAAGALVHLPAPKANARVTVVNTGAAGTITVDTPGAETINGANTVALASQYATVRVVSDGTNWYEV
jgi:hypothetical protein